MRAAEAVPSCDGKRFGFAHLLFGKCGCDRAHAVRGLDFERRRFRHCVFADREVFPNANTVQLSAHTPRRNTVPIFEPADIELCLAYAWIAKSTGNLVLRRYGVIRFSKRIP